MRLTQAKGRVVAGHQPQASPQAVQGLKGRIAPWVGHLRGVSCREGRRRCTGRRAPCGARLTKGLVQELLHRRALQKVALHQPQQRGGLQQRPASVDASGLLGCIPIEDVRQLDRKGQLLDVGLLDRLCGGGSEQRR